MLKNPKISKAEEPRMAACERKVHGEIFFNTRTREWRKLRNNELLIIFQWSGIELREKIG